MANLLNVRCGGDDDLHEVAIRIGRVERAVLVLDGDLGGSAEECRGDKVLVEQVLYHGCPNDGAEAKRCGRHS